MTDNRLYPFRVETGDVELDAATASSIIDAGITLTQTGPPRSPARYYVKPHYAPAWTAVEDRTERVVVVLFRNEHHPYPLTAATAEADRLNALDAAEEAETEDLPSVDADAARFYVDEVPGSGFTIYDREEEAINGRPFRATGWITATHPGAAEAAEAACAALNRAEEES